MSTVNEIFTEINKLITYNPNVTIISSHDEANIDKIKIKHGYVTEIRKKITEINKKAKKFTIRCELESNWDEEKDLYLFTIWYNGSIITVDNLTKRNLRNWRLKFYLV